MSYDYTSDDYNPRETARRRLAQFDESMDTGMPYMALGLSALVHALVDLGSNLSTDWGTLAEHAQHVGNVLERHPQMGPEQTR
jgi:hypothetical protein